MNLMKHLSALAAVAAVVTGLATGPAAYAGAVVFECKVTDVWTTPNGSFANACLSGQEKNISVDPGDKYYGTNPTLNGWAPYTTGSWTLVNDELVAGGLWDSLLKLLPGETIDLLVFLKQGPHWGAYYFDDVSEVLGGYNTKGYKGEGLDLSHGFILIGDRKTPPPEEVPEPTTLLLFGSALLGLGLRGRRNAKA